MEILKLMELYSWRKERRRFSDQKQSEITELLANFDAVMRKRFVFIIQMNYKWPVHEEHDRNYVNESRAGQRRLNKIYITVYLLVMNKCVREEKPRREIERKAPASDADKNETSIFSIVRVISVACKMFFVITFAVECRGRVDTTVPEGSAMRPPGQRCCCIDLRLACRQATPHHNTAILHLAAWRPNIHTTRKTIRVSLGKFYISGQYIATKPC